jgi:2-dehydropantoate 2-reductase
MHFAILGSGAVGGYYGAKLAHAGQRVTFLARGAQLKAMRERGLLVWSPLGDFIVKAEAEGDPAKVGPVDVVLLAVKTYDNDTALPMLKALTGPQTVVLSLQNGVDSVEQVAAVVGESATLGGPTYVATALAAPGLIEQTGTHRKIVFGEAFGDRTAVSARVARLGEILAAADIEVETVPDARVKIWEKFIYLSPFAGFTGSTRLPIGPLWADPHIRRQLLAAMSEVMAVARAEGVSVAPDVVDRTVSYMAGIPGTTRSSLLIDLQQGKRIEVEALQGSVVRRGGRLGVPTPIMATLYAVLKPHAAGVPRGPG